MKPKLIDTHTHVNFNAFKEDGEEIIKRALDSGIWLINVGSQLSTSRRAVKIAENYQEGVYAAIGLHPHHLYDQEIDKIEASEEINYKTKAENFNENDYLELSKSEKVVAVGECGLDYFRLAGDDIGERKERQKNIFIQQIDFASKIKKPIIIHCRDAHDDLYEILKKEAGQLPENKGVMHFFAGTLNEALNYIEMGFYISFSGVITFAKNYLELVENIPLEKILIETDAPYVAPIPYRGKRNEPGYVMEVAKKIAEIKKISFEEVSSQTTENAKIIFGLDF